MKGGSRRSSGSPRIHHCREESAGRGNPAPLCRAIPGRALGCAPALPEYPGAAHLKGEAGWAGASLEKDTCQRRLGSMPQSQPPPSSLHGSGPQRGLPGRLLPKQRAKPWKDGGFFVTRRFRVRPKPDFARRGRILGTAALVTWGQGAASQQASCGQSWLGKERTGEPRESLASNRGGNPNMKSKPS